MFAIPLILLTAVVLSVFGLYISEGRAKKLFTHCATVSIMMSTLAVAYYWAIIFAGWH